MSLLEIDRLSVSFGGVVALDDVSFSVDTAELVGVIGPNGAGKTTLIEAVSGFLPESSGEVKFADHRLANLPPHRRAHLGLVRTFQAIELFDDLTVRENLAVAAHRRTWAGSLLDIVAPSRDRYRPVVDEVIDLLDLADVADLLPPELSQGKRQLVGIARALATGPRLVMLDEPAAGLDSDESLELGRRLRSVVESGTAVLLVDHDMGLVLGSCDRVVVLDFGRVLVSGTPQEIRANEDVIAAYLGDEALEHRDEL